MPDDPAAAATRAQTELDTVIAQRKAAQARVKHLQHLQHREARAVRERDRVRAAAKR